jgi:phosphoribosylanthranilate isomerase
MTRVKICGVNSAVAFDTAVAAGADWIGFVFFERSPRFITPAQAAHLSARHAGGPPRVGLFVDPTDEAIARTLDDVALDILQLHAPPARIAALRARFALPVWRAVGVAERIDLPESAEGADALLIDAKAPKEATRPGGNARSFDWRLLDGWQPRYPWLLAGGLTPANVAEAVRISGAPAVDVSSGVESAPGVKDPALIHDFVAAARAA